MNELGKSVEVAAKQLTRSSFWDAPSKPGLIRIEVVENSEGEEALNVKEVDNTPYSAPLDRTGFYNMSLAYWMRNEFPVWARTAHITIEPYGLRLS